MMELRTTEGPQTPSEADVEYMLHLDELVELPGDQSYGLLLFKGDPAAFRQGRDDWQLANTLG